MDEEAYPQATGESQEEGVIREEPREIVAEGEGSLPQEKSKQSVHAPQASQELLPVGGAQAQQGILLQVSERARTIQTARPETPRARPPV